MRYTHYTIDAEIIAAVDEGLSSVAKALPSWLLYDAEGDKIFQSIMRLPEYYPSRCEYQVLQRNKEVLMNYFSHDNKNYQLIELGAGDAIKTEILLEYFVAASLRFKYVPVDVSETVLRQLVNRLHVNLPELDVEPRCRRYEDSFDTDTDSLIRKVILFLGANIGNYTRAEAQKFLGKIRSNMKGSDLVMVGFDLKKDPRIIQGAYDDSKGITRNFNLNLLKRLNRELGADFHVDQFEHYPFYDPVTGEAKSFLVSCQEQEVFIDAVGKTFHFSAWETIHTELSQKYDLSMITQLASRAGLNIIDILYDEKKYFCDVLMRATS